ncbi:MAG: FAD-dependent oxidoreductase [Gammaproteobacteria bacterium]|nr:FAD-dependent oxidoreductase [Gammaproteobacteria bacterium]
MDHGSGATASFWLTAPLPEYPALAENAEADVCVIGAGIAGLTTAYRLVREGRSVIVIDDGPVGGGETSRTTAHLSNAFDDRYHEVERLLGADISGAVADSHSTAIDCIEQIVDREGIDCDFRRVDGYLFLPPGGSKDELSKELEAAHRAGLNDVRLVDRPELSSADLGPALLFPRQAGMHPVKYLAGLAEAIDTQGGRICCRTRASEIEDGRPTRVHTGSGHTITAQATVVATNSPVNDRFVIHTKQAPYRTFVVGFKVAQGSMPRALYWDTLDPYHYVRIAGELDDRHDLLIAGGEDHKTGQKDDAELRFERLADWTRERFPVTGEPVYRWSGQVMEPVDALAFIGRNPGDEHVFIATGDSGQGITHGTIAGMLLCDLIVGRDNRWRDAYDPSRKSVKAITEFAKENINVAGQYAAWVTPGDISAIEDIPAGEGAVVRRHARKIAAYRDADGTVHTLDATCPHLGCVVAWNSTEKSWDCPCHGSRFDATGRVVNGPSIVDLSRMDLH